MAALPQRWSLAPTAAGKTGSARRESELVQRRLARISSCPATATRCYRPVLI